MDEVRVDLSAENLPDSDDFWQKTLTKLAECGKVSDFDLALIRQSKGLGENGDAVVFSVSSQTVKNIIETKYLDLVKWMLGVVLDRPIGNCIITIDDTLAAAFEPDQTSSEPAPPAAPAPPAPASIAEPVAPVQFDSLGAANIDTETGLNPKYTFETFVIGSSNSFTAAAAESVVVSPAQAYNPLFIYGGSGLGKTHLLHAIGNYALELDSNTKVKYVSSEEFTNEFINAIATGDRNGPSAFQAKYREVDFLLLDDIQFLQNKEGIIEEFFHTFNTLHNAQKQVVITSDVPPKELNNFEERIKSRLEWGLMTDVQPPNLETRIAILRRKATQENMQVPHDVIEYIASNISSNIRELEGALIRVTALASLTHEPVTLESAQYTLRDYITSTLGKEITPAMIINETANYFGISADDILSADRSRTVVEPRQIAMYLCRELTSLSLPKVGSAFGGRDHTTVMHAVKKITSSMNENSKIYHSVSEITNRVRRASQES